MSISKEKLQKLLPQLNIKAYDITDSTNNTAKSEKVYSLVAAASQNAGRGRFGKSFFSPEGGVYMSIVLPETSIATLRAAIGVCRAVESVSKSRMQIKWVNDIFSHGKKVAGILCELSGGRIIVGVGINIGAPDFPKDLASLAGAVDITTDRETLIADVANEIIRLWEADGDEILTEYESRLFVIGKEITYTQNGKKFTGTVLGICADGSLRVSKNGSVTILNSGEISLGSDSFASGD